MYFRGTIASFEPFFLYPPVKMDSMLLIFDAISTFEEKMIPTFYEITECIFFESTKFTTCGF